MCGQCVGAVDLMALDRRNVKGVAIRGILYARKPLDEESADGQVEREWKIYYIEAAKMSNAKAYERHQNGALQVYPVYPNHAKS